MAYQITDACVSCGACESQCPVGAISGELRNPFTIDTCGLFICFIGNGADIDSLLNFRFCGTLKKRKFPLLLFICFLLFQCFFFCLNKFYCIVIFLFLHLL